MYLRGITAAIFRRCRSWSTRKHFDKGFANALRLPAQVQSGEERIANGKWRLLRHQRRYQRVEHLYAIGHAEFRFAGAFRMRHHTEHIALRVADSGDVLDGAVGIRFGCNVTAGRRVTEDNAVLVLQFRQRLLIAEVIAFHVADGNFKYLALGQLLRERRIRILDPNVHRLADVLQSGIAHQRARKQARLAQNLEAVADAENQSAVGGELAHRLHYLGELSDRACAQVIAVSESARNDDRVATLQVGRVVPKESHWLLGDMLNRPVRVVVTVRTGENNDAE